jgi:putative DNA methylase
MIYKRKLIEVALPLEAINREASKRKRKAPAAYPTSIHKWWAQRPVAACRAVLFASLIDDPSSDPDRFPTEEDQEKERQRLFGIIEDLVRWENGGDSETFVAARGELTFLPETPVVLDPFAGGGSIPLEAVRLGLRCHASDLNPVATLITKALAEIPGRFSGAQIEPERGSSTLDLPGSAIVRTLAEDIRFFGDRLVAAIDERVGKSYPPVELPEALGGGLAQPVAYLWAHTATCPNPACGARMPLVQSLLLASRGGQTWLDPVVDKETLGITFKVRTGPPGPPPSPKIGRGGNFRCLACGELAPEDHLKAQGMAGLISTQLLAIVAQSGRRRVYVEASRAQVAAAEVVAPAWVPKGELAYEPRAIWCSLYGLTEFEDLFTTRQLGSLTTYVDCLRDLYPEVQQSALRRGLSDTGDPLSEGGSGARAYADAVVTYLALALGRAADYGCRLATWRPKDSAMRSGLAKQALPFAWDFAEGNPFGPSSSGFRECIHVIATAVAELPSSSSAEVSQLDAKAIAGVKEPAFVCTDPPYYDNIGYADLSDFFYVWLRPALRDIWPLLFSTLLTPKQSELIASPYRSGSKAAAQSFFESGLEEAFSAMRGRQDPDYPLALFYAFKQAEGRRDVGDLVTAIASTGWESMLEALLRSGLMVTGTWPMRTEGDNRQVGIGANALATSVVLTCRPRPESAGLATRKDFIGLLRSELPIALRRLQQGSIAPVDLAQAAIGPGMAIYSQYARILEADGSRMSVRAALGIINQVLDETLAEQEADFDPDTRWAVAWFEQYGMNAGPFGIAETLSKAKNTAVNGLVDAGILESRAGRVRLLGHTELLDGWDPAVHARITVWEVTQRLIHALLSNGEEAAAGLLRRVGGLGETARELAYRLYVLCERKKWAAEALSYNSLVIAWPEIARLAVATPAGAGSARLFEDEGGSA